MAGVKLKKQREKFEENPFTDPDGFSLRLTKKNKQLGNASPLEVRTIAPAASEDVAITTSEGQRVGTAKLVVSTVVDSEPFVKVFVGELHRFFDLSPTALRIITVLLKDLGNRTVGPDRLYITEKSITDTLKASPNQKPPSTASYYRAIDELCEKGFIAPSTNPPLYFINPAIFFNGDRVHFIREIRKAKDQSESPQGQIETSAEGQNTEDPESITPLQITQTGKHKIDEILADLDADKVEETLKF